MFLLNTALAFFVFDIDNIFLISIIERNHIMSTYLEILSETSYQEFLNKINNNSSFEEINEFFESAVIYDTSFSYGSGSDRLLGIINKAEPYSDDFTKEFEHNMYRMRKNQLIELVHDPLNEYLRESWNFALNALQSINNNEYLYFDID